MKLSLRVKVMGILVVTSVFATGTAIWVANKSILKNGVTNLTQKAEAILSRTEVSRGVLAEIKAYEHLMQAAIDEFPDGDVPKSRRNEILKTVPIYGAMEVGEKNASLDDYEFTIFASEPRNKENMATPEQLKILDEFRSKTKDMHLEINHEQGFVSVSKPVFLDEEQGCLICHGQANTSPFDNGKDVMGYDMEGWKDGDLHGAFQIKADLAPTVQAQKEASWEIIKFSGLVTALAITAAFFLINQIIRGFNRMTSLLRREAGAINNQSDQLSSSSQSLSSATIEQVSAIQETVASMSEMSSMIGKTGDRAKESQTLSESVTNQTAEGTQIMQQMGNSMDSIQEANTQLEKISGIIDDISEKTQVINDIVFQTRLLSFNASIEAARAGQHGQGFAVVAEEVGNLAQMSGEAAKEINNLLAGSKKEVNDIVELTRGRVEEGKGVAEQALTIFGDIAEKAGRLNSEVASVTEATQEQEVGVNQVGKAMDQMNQTTQINSQASNDLSECSEEIQETSSSLARIACDLQIMVTGKEVTESNDGEGDNRTNQGSGGKKQSSKQAVNLDQVKKFAAGKKKVRTPHSSSDASDSEEVDGNDPRFTAA